MKWLTILLITITFYNSNAFAQHSTGCCLVNSNPEKVIEKDTLASECLLCSKIDVRDSAEKFYSADALGMTVSNWELTKLEHCRTKQLKVIISVIDLLTKYNKRTGNQKYISLKKLIRGVNLMSTTNVLDQLNNKETSQKSSRDIICNNQDKDISLTRSNQELLVKSFAILDAHKSMRQECPDYLLNKEEKSIIEELNKLNIYKQFLDKKE